MKTRQLTILVPPEVYDFLAEGKERNGYSISANATIMIEMARSIVDMANDPEYRVYVEHGSDTWEIQPEEHFLSHNVPAPDREWAGSEC